MTSTRKPITLTLAQVRTALQDPATAEATLGQHLPLLSPASIKSMGALIFDILRLPDQDTSRRALKCVAAHRREWIDQLDENGNTPLMVAARTKNLDAVIILLSAGARIDQRNDKGEQVLDIAAKIDDDDCHQRSMAQALLEKSTFTQQQKDNAIYEAVIHGNASMFDALLEHGADPLSCSLRCSILVAACLKDASKRASQQLQILSTLLKLEGAMEVIDKGWAVSAMDSPLHTASSVGNSGTVRILINAGASVNPPPDQASSKPITPLMRAAFGGHLQTVRLLLAAGANASLVDFTGANVLHHLVCASINLKDSANLDQTIISILDQLCAAGADLCAVNNEGKTPIDLARLYCHDALADHLDAIVSSRLMAEATQAGKASVKNGQPRI